MTVVAVGREKNVEVVPSFFNLGDCLSSCGSCETRCHRKTPCRMGPIQLAPAHPHLPLISHHLQRKSLHLHASGTWAPTPSGLHNLQRNDRAIIRCLCGVTIKKTVHKISWIGYNSTVWIRYPSTVDWDSITVSNVVITGWRNPKKLNPVGSSDRGQKWSAWTA